MFRCEKCDTVVPAGVSAERIIVQRRPKEYPVRTRSVQRGRGRRPQERTIDRGGRGHEIVRELKVCPDCAEELRERIGEVEAQEPQPTPIPADDE